MKTDNPKIILNFDLERQEMSFDGPIQNRILCLGMLELAKTIVTNGDQTRTPREVEIIKPKYNGILND